MACFHPLRAYKSKVRKTETGKQLITFRKEEISALPYEKIDLPCGQCIGCRIQKSMEWSLRIMHESDQHIENCFITLTYDDEHLPKGGKLVRTHFTEFIRELRRSRPTIRIRYFMCGEYGEKYDRPHYHAAIFNYQPIDMELWYRTDRGDCIYTSDELDSIWKRGIVAVGDLTIESAAYIARYVIKKLNGGPAFDKYLIDFNEETGECEVLEPEYITMSLRPGVGKNWFEKYSMDCYPKDWVTYNGKKFKIPRYYQKLYEVENEQKMKWIKNERKKTIMRNMPDNTLVRLQTKEKLLQRKVKRLERSYEYET